MYPQTELPTDPGTLRRYVARVEELGFRHILAYDHVVGADPAVYPDWAGPYNVDSTFHEPMVLYGFLAAITELELVTGIIIAPQRQTVLLAKQAAEIDILTSGRCRIGLGIGWNQVEYQALGEDFTTRGRRLEEQVGLLRRLWTQRSVTFEGRFDRVTGAGLAPLPTRQPVPIWMGGRSPVAYRRIGRLADGWFPQVTPGPSLDEAMATVAEGAREVGRAPDAIGMEGRISQGSGPADELVEQAERWRQAGASHLSVNTMGSGLQGLDGHLDALSRAGAALQPS